MRRGQCRGLQAWARGRVGGGRDRWYLGRVHGREGGGDLGRVGGRRRCGLLCRGLRWVQRLRWRICRQTAWEGCRRVSWGWRWLNGRRRRWHTRGPR